MSEKNLIADLVAEVTEEVESLDAVQAASNDDTEKVVVLDTPKPPKPTRKFERPKPPKRDKTTKSPEPEDLMRTYAKATVQKTIRFRPTLIAQLDDHLLSLKREGRERTLTNVMNNALELWLDTNAKPK